MKKIYFLLLIGLAFTTLGYGQTFTIATQNWDGAGNNWPKLATSPSETDPNDTSSQYLWRETDQLTSGLGSIGGAGSSITGNFFGLRSRSNTFSDYMLYMEPIDISGYENIEISFDYEYISANNTYTPTISYQIYEYDSDGNPSQLTDIDIVSQGANNNINARTVTIPINTLNPTETTIDLRININFHRTHQNFDDFIIGLDNFKIISNGNFSGYVLQDGTWTAPLNAPPAPDFSTGGYNALIVNGTYEISTDIELQNIFTEAGAGISIQSTGSLTVNDINTANNLILNSTSTNYSSLIVNGSVTGNAKYSRHVNSTGNDLISSPLPGETFIDFIDTDDNLSNLVPVGINQVLFGPFDKDFGDYRDWSTADLNNELEPAVGYRASTLSQNSNLVFSGNILTSSISSLLTYTSRLASQWNLVGNPYTSYLDMSNFVSTNISLFQTGKEAVYGYDGNNGWVIFNQSTDILMTPGQGFYVAIPLENSGQSLIFNPNMRTIGSDDDFVAGRTADIHKTHFTLALSTGETKRHTTAVYFNDIASLGFDKGYDATIYGNNYSGFTMFTQLVEDYSNFKIGIQTLPNSNLGTGIAIPLGIIAPKGEQITLDIIESTLNEGATVYLEDTKTNTWTLLSDKPYTFTTDTKLSGLGRFILHTTDQSRLSVEENILESIQIFTGRESLRIKGDLGKNTKLSLYDIQGRQITNTILNNTVREYTLSTVGYTSGVYIVKIENELGNQISKRVILK
ncbi:T9SS type A sorting domain-containing protein [Formosa sp. S-31]|uniref:T9SS type A sorting domain-containing protein n=1 Tax=Formosa sp. S-31 TaxID=2790949 RepID=UPI003EC00AE3